MNFSTLIPIHSASFLGSKITYKEEQKINDQVVVHTCYTYAYSVIQYLQLCLDLLQQGKQIVSSSFSIESRMHASGVIYYECDGIASEIPSIS